MRSKYRPSNLTSQPSFRPLPDRKVQQQLTRARRTKVGFFSVGAIALVTFSMMWNPPTGDIHNFTKASDYVAARDSGCTNSGDGCHGAETAYTDFNEYHPNADCTTCHDYEGVGCIPCHAPDGHECQSCHDGTMESAGDRTRIVDPYPRGHYRETTHTATGTDLKAEMRSAEDGNAKTTCRSCHARDLYAAHQKVPQADDSPYGESVGCGECHNDTRSAGLAQVKDDWKKRRCEDCHTEESSSPMHAAAVAPSAEPSAGAGCDKTGSGCHDVRDLHALHPDAPKDCSGSATRGEPGCHDLELQAHVPTATACGDGDDSCHAPYKNDQLAHDKDAEVHSPGTAVGSDSFLGVACGSCHDTRNDGVSLITEHALPTSAQAKGGPCRGCHNDPASADAVAADWAERDTTSACDACHGSDSVDPTHDTDIAGAHVAQESDGCADSGAGCHDTNNLSLVTGDAAIHESCLRCHDWTRDGRNLAYEPGAKSCGSGRSCHNEPGLYEPRNAAHRGAGGVAAGLDAPHTAATSQRDLRVTDRTSGLTFECGDCHSMALGAEHARPNSALAGSSPRICTRCHNASLEVAAVVKDSWPSRTSIWACEACHIPAGRSEAHAEIGSAHAAVTLDATGVPSATACTGSDCHGTTDLRALHTRTGCKTEGCHQSTGDILVTGTSTCGGPDSGTACHTGMHAGVDGYDPLHRAGDAQGDASLEDTSSGLSLTCLQCHTMQITTEHERISSGLSEGEGSVCLRCHTANDIVDGVVRGDWTARDTALACVACHTVTGDTAPHLRVGDVHFGLELDLDGATVAGTCSTTGCHQTTDVRRLHRAVGCTPEGCHQATDDIRGSNTVRCGGADDGTSCHPGISATDHDQDHSADLTGTVEGITYSTGSNVGCFGCHARDLTREHSTALLAGSMDGGGSSTCRVCHDDPDDPGSGDFSGLAVVRQAIEDHDRRCTACHRSGSAEDTTTGVASPHKAFSTDENLPDGAVWSDPLDDWRQALDSVTGGGHNALPASAVGATRDKAFPITLFEIGGATYPWALPANSGATAWLRTIPLTPVNPTEGPWDEKLFPSATTTEGIQASMVTCEDCHEMGDLAGPQGAAVKIGMDPDYAQTEWANPTPGTYQFDPYNVDTANPDNPAGYKPVICVKCHLVYARARTGTTSVYVGGTSFHSTHRSRHGEVCISCHVSIPHAWKRPRLLPRTVTAQGVEPDVFPYVRQDHDGLTGIALTITTRSNPVARDTCATGGCYSNYYLPALRSESATNHPVAGRDLPADQAYWP